VVQDDFGFRIWDFGFFYDGRQIRNPKSNSLPRWRFGLVLHVLANCSLSRALDLGAAFTSGWKANVRRPFQADTGAGKRDELQFVFSVPKMVDRAAKTRFALVSGWKA